MLVATFTFAQTLTFTATVSGANEVPAIGSTGSADVTSTYVDATGMITITATYSGLSSGLTMAHLHVVPAGANGPVIVNLMTTTVHAVV